MTAFSVARPGFLLLLVAVVPVYVLWRRWRPPLSPGRSRLALGTRLVLVVLLVGSLADVQLSRRPDRRAVVAVVDLSDSTQAFSDEAAEAVRAMLAAKSADDLFGVVTFGRNALVEVAPSARPTFEGFETNPDGAYSNLDGALRLAANLIPPGYARQVVLVSDGRQNLGDAVEAVSELRRRSVRVDVLPVGRPPGAEALVLALEAPAELRAGQSLTANARLHASGPAQGTLTLEVAGRNVESRPVDLPAGASSQAFSLPPLDPGVHRLRATLDADTDTYSQNDVAESVVRVVGPPAVLVLEGSVGEGANVASALEAAAMRVETRPAEEAPTDAAALAAYDSIVVVDAPAAAFPPQALPALATSVQELGRGLVAIGGSRAYGAGGWGSTPLEEALPVQMEIPQAKQRPAVAVALLLETMESPFGDGVALGAAGSVIDRLTPEDEMAVVNMQSPTSSFIVPLTQAVDKAAAKQRIASTVLGDPPGYGEALTLAFDALAASTAANKHVIILGDGDAEGHRGSYDAVFARARAEQIIVSAVGIDTHFNAFWMDHMRDIGRRGGGGFYQSDTANQVPGLLLDASRSALRGSYDQEPFFPEVTSAGDLLAGVALDEFPELGGHVITTAKAEADVALSTPKGDPLLAGWQHGLGRTVAWTSDAGGRWSAGFLGSPVSAEVFARMAAWSMPSGGSQPLQVEATPAGDGLDVEVTGPEGGGDLGLQVVAPDLTSFREELAFVSPGRWRATLPATQLGTYVLHAVLQRKGVEVGRGDVSVPVPYSPEYLELGRDEGFLGQLAGPSGSVLTGVAEAWSLPVPRVAVSDDLFWTLLLTVVVLWPLDVALRRLNLPARQLLSVVGSLLRRGRPAHVEAALPPSLAQARARIEARRHQGLAAPPLDADGDGRGGSDGDEADIDRPVRTPAGGDGSADGGRR